MASKAVRDIINNFLAANYSSYPVFDLTGIVDSDDLPKRSNFVAKAYGASTEERSALNRCFKENGLINLICMRESKADPTENVDDMLTMVEELRDLFRGLREGELFIFTVDPGQFQQNAEFQVSGFISCTIALTYEYRFNI